MKSMQWKTYRTRFLVKAKQLNSNLSFIDPLGRQHSGRKGDYLVESSEGVISIAPRKIFEDIYIAMRDDNVASQSSKRKVAGKQSGLPLNLPFSAFGVETIQTEKFHPHFNDVRQPDSQGIARAHRKSPQPVRPSSSRMSLM